MDTALILHKKNRILSLIILLPVLFQLSALGQPQTRVDRLNAISLSETQLHQLRQEEARKWALRNNVPTRFKKDDVLYELQYIDEKGTPQYFQTDNAIAAQTISTNKLYPSGGLGLNLTGAGIVVRVWDGGTVLSTHQELNMRVTNVNTSSVEDHATHVAGTIMAAGLVANAKGMAYQSSVRSFDWNNDVAEMADEGANGALISNHSYGYVRGWSNGVWYGNSSISTQEDYLFGFYDNTAKAWDNVANNAPYLLIVKSAGNDRGNSGEGYPADGPYDCIGQQGIAKNILTVGAVNDIAGGYTAPGDVVMSSFSSWGPADDGRIKPDIVANGVGLYSTVTASNSSYATYSGTSMASPSVSGSLALLQQHHNNLKGSYLLASTLKALVIHTADEAGSNNGPDYQFGWGLMNTAKAANMITNDVSNNVLSEHILASGGNYTRQVIANGAEPLKVTIVWNDPSGNPVAASLDPITPMLVNDLDLRVTRSTSTYYPWKLDRNTPTNAATNSAENNVDNVEVVYIGSPVAGGTYTITVDHDGTLQGGSQAFSLVVSGIQSSVAPVANFVADKTSVAVNTTVNFTDLSTNTPTSWLWAISPATYTYMDGTSASSQNPKIRFNAIGNYSVMLTATNASGSDTETKVGYISVFSDNPLDMPYQESFESAVMPPSGWKIVDQDGDGNNWNLGSNPPYLPVEGNYVGYSESVKTGVGPLVPDNWIISPGFDVTTDSVVFSFYVHAFSPTQFAETFSVMVSWTGDNTSDFQFPFTITLENENLWQISYSILGGAGLKLYFAIRHHDSTNQSQLVLDNISINEYGIVENLLLSGFEVESGINRCFNANNTIFVAGDGNAVSFLSGSSTSLIAGQSIKLLPGFHAYQGASSRMWITTNNQFCSTASFNISARMEKTMIVEGLQSKSSFLAGKVNKNDQIRIYPNPNTGKFQIAWPANQESSAIRVFNSLGSMVHRSAIQPGALHSIDLSHLNKGIYFVNLKNGRSSYTRKIIIK